MRFYFMVIRFFWTERPASSIVPIRGCEVSIIQTRLREWWSFISTQHRLNFNKLLFMFYHALDQMVAWPSGLRRWFKAPVSSEARVRIPPLPNFFELYFNMIIIFILNKNNSSCNDKPNMWWNVVRLMMRVYEEYLKCTILLKLTEMNVVFIVSVEWLHTA